MNPEERAALLERILNAQSKAKELAIQVEAYQQQLRGAKQMQAHGQFALADEVYEKIHNSIRIDFALFG